MVKFWIPFMFASICVNYLWAEECSYKYRLIEKLDKINWGKCPQSTRINILENENKRTEYFEDCDSCVMSESYSCLIDPIKGIDSECKQEYRATCKTFVVEVECPFKSEKSSKLYTKK